MKICIPAEDDRGGESRMSGHFGSAPFFAMVDTEGSQVEMVRNPGCGHGHHGQGQHGQGQGHGHHIQQMKTHGVDAVVCQGIGRGAFAALDHAGIEVLTAPATTVSDVVETVRAGKTAKLSAGQACGGGRHGHGHQGGCSH